MRSLDQQSITMNKASLPTSLVLMILALGSHASSVTFLSGPNMCSSKEYTNKDPDFLYCLEIDATVVDFGEFNVTFTGKIEELPTRTDENYGVTDLLLYLSQNNTKLPFDIALNTGNEDIISLNNQSNICVGIELLTSPCFIYVQPPILRLGQIILHTYAFDILGVDWVSMEFNPPEVEDLQEWKFNIFRFRREITESPGDIQQEEETDRTQYIWLYTAVGVVSVLVLAAIKVSLSVKKKRRKEKERRAQAETPRGYREHVTAPHWSPSNVQQWLNNDCRSCATDTIIDEVMSI